MKDYTVKVSDDESKSCVLNARWYREDKPAVVDDGNQKWWLNGKMYREHVDDMTKSQKDNT